VHEGRITLIVRRETDVETEDVVEVSFMNAGKYRVTAIESMGASVYKRLTLERVDKPINPVEEESS
jgi:hypothetical protein